jgi:hypothetical protein
MQPPKGYANYYDWPGVAMSEHDVGCDEHDETGSQEPDMARRVSQLPERIR